MTVMEILSRTETYTAICLSSEGELLMSFYNTADSFKEASILYGSRKVKSIILDTNCDDEPELELVI